MADKLKVYVETSFVCYLTGDQTANAKITEYADKAYEAFLARTRAA